MPNGPRNFDDFPTTWWTLIDQAVVDDSAARGNAVEQLVRQYAAPLRAHLVLRKRLQPELADDLVQSFITEKILARYLLQHADRTKGKFRSLLLRSLDNYYIEWRRKQRAQPVTGLADQFEAADRSWTDADVFDIAWARQLIEEVLATMRADCEANRQANIWGVFECRLLVPLRERTEPITYEDVCTRFGFESPEQASNALVTAKRKFQKAFKQITARHRHDGEQSSDVLRELIDILSQAGPLEWQRVPESFQPGPCESVLLDSEPALVARMLGSVPDTDKLWRQDDLGALLRHQLAQRLADLDRSVSECLENESITLSGNAPLNTLDDLYRHPLPSIELLNAVKQYGRALAKDPAALLQHEIASVVYFGCIAAALVRHNQRISTSSDEILRVAFDRFRQQSWMSVSLNELFARALEPH